MKIRKDMTVHKVVSQYPHLKEVFIKFGFKSITDPFKFSTVAKIMTLGNACKMKDVDINIFLEVLNAAAENTAPAKSALMAEHIEINEERAAKIGDIVRKFFDGADKETIEEEYAAIAPVTAAEFAYAEQVISDSGVPDSSFETKIDKLIAIFRSSLDKEMSANLPAGHPVLVYIKENNEIVKLTAKARKTTNASELLDLFNRLKDINLHFVRKETQLFPHLERKGFDKPSTVMWNLHDNIRKGIKEAIADLKDGKTDGLTQILDDIDGMVFKEEKVLFPTAMMMLNEEDWRLIKKGEKELGYCFIESADEWDGDVQVSAPSYAPADTGLVGLGEGLLTVEQLDALFRYLPFDVSFVDHEDRVRFYNAAPERIFPRSPDVIGREVRFCHPPKSVDTVMEILNSFRNGSKDKAEFWLTLHGKFLHIRYFAVRNKEGKYLGTLEVMQDATGVRSLEGSRTLLSWE